MRNEIAVKTIDNSFKIGRNHLMIQQGQKMIVVALLTQLQTMCSFDSES